MKNRRAKKYAPFSSMDLPPLQLPSIEPNVKFSTTVHRAAVSWIASTWASERLWCSIEAGSVPDYRGPSHEGTI